MENSEQNDGWIYPPDSPSFCDNLLHRYPVITGFGLGFGLAVAALTYTIAPDIYKMMHEYLSGLF